MFETPMASVALKTILEKAWSGVRMSRSNLRYLLSIDEHSLFSKYIRQSAAMLTRLWTENSASSSAPSALRSLPAPVAAAFAPSAMSTPILSPTGWTKPRWRIKFRSFATMMTSTASPWSQCTTMTRTSCWR